MIENLKTIYKQNELNSKEILDNFIICKLTNDKSVIDNFWYLNIEKVCKHILFNELDLLEVYYNQE